MFPKNLMTCVWTKDKDNGTIFKINFQLWVIVRRYKDMFSLQLFDPHCNSMPRIEFMYTKEQATQIIQRLIREQTRSGMCYVVRNSQ